MTNHKSDVLTKYDQSVKLRGELVERARRRIHNDTEDVVEFVANKLLESFGYTEESCGVELWSELNEVIWDRVWTDLVG